MEEKKHARLRFPNWDIETIVAEAISNNAYGELTELERVQLNAQVALGVKALDQQPKQLDPVSFQAASVAADLMFSAGSNTFRELGAKLKNMPEGQERQDTKNCWNEGHKLMAFAEQSFGYLKDIEVSFGPQVGHRR